MEIKFGICEKVFYFNTAECKVMSAEVKGAQVVPTGISKSESGENVLDGAVVLYQTFEGPVLSEQECFRSEEECQAWYKEYFDRGGHIAK